MKNEYSFLIAGEWRKSEQTLDVRFPFSDEPFCRIYLGSDADMESAIVSARQGFAKTRKLSSYQRSTILYQLLEQMEKRTDELIETLVMEGGKVLNIAQGEVTRAKETIRVSAEEAKRVGGELVPIDWTKAGEGRIGLVRRFPIGVIGCISPFNYPLNLSCHKIGPAIAAGNSIILKPPSATPLSGLLLGEMLLETDYPREAINVLPCRNQIAQKLVTDDRVAFITFTGSSEVGWRLKSLAGQKRVTMELGGNAAAIVHEDANLEYAVGRIANGAMANAGQNCISVQRVYLHRPIYNQSLEMILDRISGFKVGDPRQADTVVGPMISKAAAEEAYQKVQDAVAKGAKIVFGGKLEGSIFYPTVLTDTTPEMSVNATEMFAPVITVGPYDTWEEALTLANTTDFGLQSGIFTQDINRIMQAYEEIEVGGLQVNDVSTFRVDQMPYGGVKDSGSGREGPKYAIEEMTEPKLLVLNLQPGVR
jgi:acyl-CoA reductase-like NAD-dependent aldehyde dehydrogenase